MPIFVNNIDLNSNELQNAVIQNLAADPVSGAEEGKVYFNTTAKELRVYNGTVWEAVGLNGVTADAAEINILDGATLSTAELNFVDGVTSDIQTQINGKAPLASPTFTGTVTIPTGASITAPSGLVKGDVGLGNVDNTADTAKPVSTAQQTALNLKADLASPTFTGTVVLPDNTVALGTKTTGDYVATITAGTGVSSTAATTGEGTTHSLSIGQAVGTADNVTFAGVTADAITIGVTAAGEIDTTSGNLTIDSAGGTVTVDDNLVVTGNLTVSGTTTTINTEEFTVDDNIIVLNNNVTATPTENAGIEIERGTSTNVVLRWNETDDKWQFTNDGATYVNIASTADVSAVSVPTLDSVGDVTITTAADGQFLKWNGSAWVNDAIDLGTDTTGNYVSDVTAGTGITVTHTPGEGSSAAVAIASNYAGQNTITTLGTVTTGTWNGTAIAIAYGGTGANSASAARLNLGASVASASATLPQKLSFDIGNNSATSFVLTHSLNTRDVTVQVAEKESPYEVVMADVVLTSVDTITVTFASAPTSNQYRAVIIG